MPRWTRIALLLAVAFAALQWIGNRPAQVEPRAGVQHAVGLPPEAVATLEQIKGGGPFAYDRDGSVFQNRERRLPDRPSGYYREYTVPTPGSPDRGARRIVTGGKPPEVYYYTDDHYRSFRRLEIGR